MSFSIANTLSKMGSSDKDYRYMATSDLISEIEKDNFVLDAVSAKQLVSQVLILLDDSSNDVQEIAAKCLGPLTRNVPEAQVLHIAQTLVGHLLVPDKRKAELRDISSIALRTVFGELSASEPSTARVVESLAAKLVTGLSEDSDITPAREQHLLEVMAVLLDNFGGLVKKRGELQTALLPLLTSSRSATRKRAIDCLSLLAVHATDAQFETLVKHLLALADPKKAKRQDARTVMQLFGAVSRTVGFRLGPFLDRVIPIVAQHCESDAAGDDDDLREHCIQCFQTLVERCPADITPHVDRIEALSIQFLSYDPNYADDMSDVDDDDFPVDDDDDGFGNDGFDDDGYLSENGLSDDDDMSWKVRRACAKCLASVMDARPERALSALDNVAPVLVKRFAEREDNVKMDIFDTFRSLLRQARRTATSASSSKAPASPSQAKIDQVASSVVVALAKQITKPSSSTKTRLGALSVLRSLTVATSGENLAPHAKLLSDAIVKALTGQERDNSNLRIESLLLLRTLLKRCAPNTFSSVAGVLVPPVLAAVSDSYYRIATEGLRTASALTVAVAGASDRDAMSDKMFDSAIAKMELADVDQDVKESVTECMASLLCVLGATGARLSSALKLLLDRLGNEITRLSACRAFERIALADTNVELDAILGDTMGELAALLRQSARQLRQAALQCVTVLAHRYGDKDVCRNQFGAVLLELTSLVSDSDLHHAHLALTCATTMIEAHADVADAASMELVPPLLKLLNSSLLQGAALNSVRMFVKTLASTNKAHASALVEKIRALVGKTASSADVSFPTCNAAAQCVAVCLACDNDLVAPLIKDVLKEIKSAKTGEMRVVIDLLFVREVGARVSLDSMDLHAPLLACFDKSVAEDVKQAVALAIGGSAVGALDTMFPKVLDALDTNADKQYLLLSAVREVISRVASEADGTARLAPFLERLMPMLVTRCDAKEEGARNIVAECMGKMAVLSPETVMQELGSLLDSSSPTVRATVISALKLTMGDRSATVVAKLDTLMPTILGCLSDKDLECRKAALLAFHYAAHSQPGLIAGYIESHIDALQGEMPIKEELIREVELGPFKHNIDDGQELRKAAYECAYTLLGAGYARFMKIPEFLAHLSSALADTDDIRMLAHLIIVRLATVAGPSLIEGIDQLVEPIRATLTTVPKESAVKQEIERNNELVRSAMRAVRAAAALDGISTATAFQKMVATTLVDGELADQYKKVLQEENTGDAALASSLTASQRDHAF